MGDSAYADMYLEFLEYSDQCLGMSSNQGCQVLAGEKNLKGGPKDNFLKFSLNVKGVPTYVSK